MERGTKFTLALTMTAAVALALMPMASAYTATYLGKITGEIKVPYTDSKTYALPAAANYAQLLYTSGVGKPDFDMCFYTSNGFLLKCYATYGNEMGWIPAGAATVVVSLVGGLDAAFELRLWNIS